MRDLTHHFLKIKNVNSEENSEDPKARFLIRDSGFMMGMSSPDGSLTKEDKGALLPQSTKASSNSEDGEELQQISGGLS